MILFLGGFPGSGRRVLAEKIAMKYNIHTHDFDRFRLREAFVDDNGRTLIRRKFPRLDKSRMRLYERVVGEFPMLSKMYERVLIEDDLHRHDSREYLFAQARKYFDEIALVWVEVDDAQAMRNFADMAKRGVIQNVTELMRRRELARSGFEPFPYPVATFTYSDSDPDPVTRLWELARADAKQKKF